MGTVAPKKDRPRGTKRSALREEAGLEEAGSGNESDQESSESRAATRTASLVLLILGLLGFATGSLLRSVGGKGDGVGALVGRGAVVLLVENTRLDAGLGLLAGAGRAG